MSTWEGESGVANRVTHDHYTCIRRDDRSSWRQPARDLKHAKRDPLQAKMLTARVRGVIDDLLGKDQWPPPRDWGRRIATMVAGCSGLLANHM